MPAIPALLRGEGMQTPSKEAGSKRARGQRLLSAVKLTARHQFANICKRCCHVAAHPCTTSQSLVVAHCPTTSPIIPEQEAPELQPQAQAASILPRPCILQRSRHCICAAGAVVHLRRSSSLEATVGCSFSHATFAHASWKWIRHGSGVRLCMGLQLLGLLRRAMCQHQPNGCCHAQRPTHGVGHI